MHRPTRTRWFPTLLAFTLAACGACSGGPSGPGPGPEGPTGRIFFEWIPEGAIGSQPWVYDFREDGASRVPIWFPQARDPSVDTAGTSIAFAPPGTDLVIVSLKDTTQIEVWSMSHPAISQPSLSSDGALLAWVRPVGGQGAAIDLLDRASGEVTLLALFEQMTNLDVVHWFAGGDSVLTRATRNGVPVYHVVQIDGTRTEMFGFAPAFGAWAVAVSADEQWIALGGPRPGGVLDEAAPYRVEIWDLRRRALRQTIALPHVSGWLAWSPDGRYVAHAPSQLLEKRAVLELLDRTTGERKAIIPGEGFHLGAKELTWIR